MLTACSLCANSRVNFLRQSASEYVPFLYTFCAQHRQNDGTKKGTPLAQMTEVVDISRLASSCRGAPIGDILTLPALLRLLLGFVVLNLPAVMSLRGGAENDTEKPQDLPAHFAVCQAPPTPFGPLENYQVSPSTR